MFGADLSPKNSACQPDREIASGHLPPHTTTVGEKQNQYLGAKISLALLSYIQCVFIFVTVRFEVESQGFSGSTVCLYILVAESSMSYFSFGLLAFLSGPPIRL